MRCIAMTIRCAPVRSCSSTACRSVGGGSEGDGDWEEAFFAQAARQYRIDQNDDEAQEPFTQLAHHTWFSCGAAPVLRDTAMLYFRAADPHAAGIETMFANNEGDDVLASHGMAWQGVACFGVAR